MSSVITPRPVSTARSSSPKSSPTGPTTLTSVKKLAASEKCTADPPSMRSRSPNGERTESNAMEPTTVSDIRLVREGYSDRGVRRARGAAGHRGAGPRTGRRAGRRGRRSRRNELRGHPPDPQRLSGRAEPADDPGWRDQRNHSRRPSGRRDHERRRLRPEGRGAGGVAGSAAG